VVKLRGEPAQTGPSLAALAAGKAFTTALVVEVVEQLPKVTVTVYDPLLAGVGALITGFCDVEVYPPGPVHE
jgi:hypothetical protein